MIIDLSRTFLPALAFAALMASPAQAHCDGLDGPVVKAARQSLATGNVKIVQIWVQSGDDAELRAAFAKTLAVRKLNPEAKELADLYFLETVVRLHRAGEGEPFTGLKPAGRDLGPAIPAADKAVDDGSTEALAKMLTGTVNDGVRERFQRVLATKRFQGEDVAAGRAHVKAYVEFVHYVETLYTAARGSGHEESQHVH
jgi:hypothetical protein